MYRLLTTITTKGGTEEEAPPKGKGGNKIAPNMSWENILGAGERWRYD